MLHSGNPAETLEIGKRIGAELAPGSVVLLVGPLGSGKTLLAKGIALGLGITDQVVSPTYTIVSEYGCPARNPDGIPSSDCTGGVPRVTCYHVDLYRVEGREQMENLGLDDMLRADAIVLVEWGEKLEPGFALARTRVEIRFSPDGGRDILVEAGGT